MLKSVCSKAARSVTQYCRQGLSWIMEKSGISEEKGEMLCGIDDSWSDDSGIAVKGWVLGKAGDLHDVEVEVNGVRRKVTSWHSRPDISGLYPQFQTSSRIGFWVHVPRVAQHVATIRARSRKGVIEKRLAFHGGKPPPPGFEYVDALEVRKEFIRIANEEKLDLLEIGSRVVSPGSTSRRSLFPEASSYTGFDYYPDDNTDVVGDAHKLSEYFEREKFGAVFSLAVFEHLAMPWIVVAEVNKVLKTGGVTYHQTTQAWPVHERPWDFWRFSDDAMKVLFSPALGFEILMVGMSEPIRMHLDQVPPGQERFPLSSGFGTTAILARKVAEVDEERFRWDVPLEELLGSESIYPKPSRS